MIPDILSQWPVIITGLGGLGGGTFVTGVLAHRRETRRDVTTAAQAKREQTDEVALALVTKLEQRISALETEQVREREACDLRIRDLTHRLNNALTEADGMILALKHAPDKAAEIVRDIQERRAQKASRELAEIAARAEPVVAAAVVVAT